MAMLLLASSVVRCNQLSDLKLLCVFRSVMRIRSTVGSKRAPKLAVSLYNSMSDPDIQAARRFESGRR